MPKKPTYASELITRSGSHRLTLQLANHFFSRLRGLMLAAPLQPNHGLLITRCASVHTGFMRAPIDLVYLDERGCVTECVSNLRPWRGNRSGRNPFTGQRWPRTRHVLELPAGSIAWLQVHPGDQLRHPAFTAAPTPQRAHQQRQRGSAMIEFAVVGPVITLMGLASLQYGLLFFNKNQLNHASFMAARAGSTDHANIDMIQRGYAQALIPIYGGGTDTASLEKSFQKALTDVQNHSRVEILNPTAESYADFNDSALQNSEGKGKRVIPNSGQAFKSAADIRTSSGQNIQDANLLKLRITMGYAPQVPMMGTLYRKVLSWMDDGKDAFNTALLQGGRIPVVTHVVMQMQSNAIEGPTVSSPGMGNGGKPVDPGKPPVTSKPQPCNSGDTLCQNDPPASGTQTDSPAGSDGGCPAGTCCPVRTGGATTLPGDINFAFGKATLTAAGSQELDRLIASIKAGGVSSISINGYTDQIGDAATNKALSQARAEAVKAYLASHGVTLPITATGNGATNLKKELSQCSGKTGSALQDCLAENRRVEITLNP